MKLNYVEGARFGHIVLLEKTNKYGVSRGHIVWKCRCDCGKEFERNTSDIYRSMKRGSVISCGCKARQGRDIATLYKDSNYRLSRLRDGLGQVGGTTMQGITRKKLNKNNTTGYRGVSYIKATDSYQASIRICGKITGAKHFKNLADAVKHREYLERTFFQPFIEEYEAQTGHKYREADNG